MKPISPISRFWLGLLVTLILIGLTGAWLVGRIPTWDAIPGQASLSLPGDEIVAQPWESWNHAITIQAPAEEIYPWLAQIGDTRGGFYSYTFIENLFMLAANMDGRYVNARQVHPEWQDPPRGEGIIANFMAVEALQPGEYVLAASTPEVPGVQWTWLWYLQPVDEDTTQLLVRHRFIFPEEAPAWAVTAILDAGYVMERGMLLGIRERAEGHVPGEMEEPLGLLVWLAALAIGLVAAFRFVRPGGSWAYLGLGLLAVVALIDFSFIQPGIWVRAVIVLGLVGVMVVLGRKDLPQNTPNTRKKNKRQGNR
jgi:hypothetical protein